MISIIFALSFCSSSCDRPPSPEGKTLIVRCVREDTVRRLYHSTDAEKENALANGLLEALIKEHKGFTFDCESDRGFKFRHATGNIIIWILKGGKNPSDSSREIILAHAVQTGGYAEQILLGADGMVKIRNDNKETLYSYYLSRSLVSIIKSAQSTSLAPSDH